MDAVREEVLDSSGGGGRIQEIQELEHPAAYPVEVHAQSIQELETRSLASGK